MKTVLRGSIAVICLAMLVACSHRLPAPVEEHSSANVRGKLNADGTYTVSLGDTLYAIAFNYGLDHRDVAAWNEIPGSYDIYPGQNLRLSPPASARSRDSGKSSAVKTSGIKSPGKASTRANTTGTNTTTSPAPKTPKPAPPKQVAKKPSPQPPASKTTAPQSTADPQSWKWPVNGRILRGYVAGDPSRNGLDIAGKEGQPVKATAGGKVVYSGNGLIGYGELIIIKHSEKMLSAYAHNKVRLVAEGEQVSVGQKIAEMGRNDRNEELLHFEIRERGKPVNPLGYLPRK